MTQLRFSGHETFACRTFWPKKGYEFVKDRKNFNSEDSSSILGVGKNMVASIHYWMKAMNLLDEKNELTELAKYILDDEGHDPFIEDIGTIWLLHAELINSGYATIYDWFFNDFRIQKSSFSKNQIMNFIRAEVRRNGNNKFNEGTIDKDINVLCKSYNQPDYKNSKKNFEDEVSSLLSELNLMKSSKIRDTNDKLIEWYSVESDERYNLDSDIILYYIIKAYERNKTIQFRNLLTDKNSPAKVFCLTRDALYRKLKEQETKREGIFISETAGNVVLNLPGNLSAEEVLIDYYDK